jgi:hypothetical protein
VGRQRRLVVLTVDKRTASLRAWFPYLRWGRCPAICRAPLGAADGGSNPLPADQRRTCTVSLNLSDRGVPGGVLAPLSSRGAASCPLESRRLRTQGHRQRRRQPRCHAAGDQAERVGSGCAGAVLPTAPRSLPVVCSQLGIGPPQLVRGEILPLPRWPANRKHNLAKTANL